MYVIMGATGHVGHAAASALLDAGLPVTALTRRADHARDLSQRGAGVIEVEVHDIDGLRTAFRSGTRAFVLNPPADVGGDTDAEERETVRCILAALDGSGLERVVAESSYGAQPGERIGDLSVLCGLEQGLRAQPIPAAIQRAAYYMSNWDEMLEPARTRGELPTMNPAELKIPMVAPADLGETAAALLQGDCSTVEPVFVEGPERYSSADVAAAFGRALGREVKAVVTPRDQWKSTYRQLGFSEPAADAYTRMTAVSVDGGYTKPAHPVHGRVTLDSYIEALVAGSATRQARRA